MQKAGLGKKAQDGIHWNYGGYRKGKVYHYCKIYFQDF